MGWKETGYGGEAEKRGKERKGKERDAHVLSFLPYHSTITWKTEDLIDIGQRRGWIDRI